MIPEIPDQGVRATKSKKIGVGFALVGPGCPRERLGIPYNPLRLQLERLPVKIKEEIKIMNEKLKALRDAIVGQTDRTVEVNPDGEVQAVTETTDAGEETPAPQKKKPTRLAPRTFGGTESISFTACPIARASA